jgi:hypothetical protein
MLSPPLVSEAGSVRGRRKHGTRRRINWFYALLYGYLGKWGQCSSSIPVNGQVDSVEVELVRVLASVAVKLKPDRQLVRGSRLLGRWRSDPQLVPSAVDDEAVVDDSLLAERALQAEGMPAVAF